MKEVLGLVVLFYTTFCADVNILCKKSFCDDYTTGNPCIDMPDKCKIQNVTHNGLILPFPGPCNCCDYCLENIAAEESCAVGTPSSPQPTNICGNGLACIETNNKCGLIKSACTDAQKKYDDKETQGTLGHLEERPNCDRNGIYEPYKCIPGEICFCVDEEGNRIFGEIPYTAHANFLLKCGCSRGYEKSSEILGYRLLPGQHFRCKGNGDYDTIQCINGGCACTDSMDGKPTYPEISLVNITLISNTTLPCFNESKISDGEYYHECEQIYIELLKDIDILKENNSKLEVIGTQFPKCQIDGYYAAVQTNETHKFCADPNGSQIEDFIVDKTDALAETMDCKCARSRSIVTGTEKPECCINGNYKRIQCRRNLCRCVDSNGVQVVKEVPVDDINSLTCTLESECT